MFIETKRDSSIPSFPKVKPFGYPAFPQEYENIEGLMEGSANIPYLSKSSQELKNKLTGTSDRFILSSCEQNPPNINVEKQNTITQESNTETSYPDLKELIPVENRKEKERAVMQEEEVIMSRIGKKLINSSNLIVDMILLHRLKLVVEDQISTQKVPLNQMGEWKSRTDIEENEGKKVLILDLDHTLIQLKYTNSDKAPGKSTSLGQKTPIIYPSDPNFPFYLRPYAINFLLKMSKFYRIIVFTAAHKYYYPETILKKIEYMAGKNIFEGFFSREHLQSVGESCLMLKALPDNVDEGKIVIVDDTFLHWFYTPHNFVPIKRFTGDQTDASLVLLDNYLTILAGVTDVREANCKYLNVAKIFDIVLGVSNMGVFGV